eukprot:5352580-Pyramimonas_sp.AAC.1
MTTAATEAFAGLKLRASAFLMTTAEIEHGLITAQANWRGADTVDNHMAGDLGPVPVEVRTWAPVKELLYQVHARRLAHRVQHAAPHLTTCRQDP